MRGREFEEVCAVLEAFEVLGPAEWFGVEDADSFEEAVAVEKAAVENGDDGLVFREELAIEENGHGGKIRNAKFENRSKFETRKSKGGVKSARATESPRRCTQPLTLPLPLNP